MDEIDDELLDSITKLYEDAQVQEIGTTEVSFGTITPEMGKIILQMTGIEVTGFKVYITHSIMRHIYQMHGRPFDEKFGQRPVEGKDIENMPNIVKDFDNVRFTPKDRKKNKKHNSLVFEKNIDTLHSLALEIKEKSKELLVRTLYIKNR